MIVNQKLESGDNFIHFLVKKLTRKNFDVFREMIEILFSQDCEFYTRNDENLTSIDLLNIKIKSDDEFSDYLKMLIQNIAIEKSSIMDTNFISQLLVQWNSKEFIEKLNKFKRNQCTTSP